jgi:hypothetical protein
MSQIVKTKRQANFKDFKRFRAFKGLVEQKNLVFNSWAILKRSFHSRFKSPRVPKKAQFTHKLVK